MSASNRMLEYVDALSKRVNDRFNGIEEGASSYTNNCQYFVNAKIQSLNNKASEYNSFSMAVKNFYNEAREIDLDVARKIRVSKDDFIGSHDYVKEDILTEALIWAKGQIPALEFICDAIEYVFNTPGSIFYEIKEWYLHGGGKELLWEVFVTSVKVAFAGVAIVLAFYSGPIALGIAIFAGAVTIINSFSNVYARNKATFEKAIGNPRLARKYQKTDGGGDVLRIEGDEKGALIWDGITFVSDVASIFAPGVKDPGKLVKYGNKFIEVPKFTERLDDVNSYINYGWDVGTSAINYISKPTKENFTDIFKNGIGHPELRDSSDIYDKAMKGTELFFKTDDFDRKYELSKNAYRN